MAFDEAGCEVLHPTGWAARMTPSCVRSRRRSLASNCIGARCAGSSGRTIPGGAPGR